MPNNIMFALWLVLAVSFSEPQTTTPTILMNPLGPSINAPSLDGVYSTRKKRIILIDKNILHWRGRTFPLQIDLTPSGDVNTVHILGEKDLLGRPVIWGTACAGPTLNFFVPKKQHPFLTLRKLPAYTLVWPKDIEMDENKKPAQQYYDRLAHLVEAEEFDLLADYIGHENITVIRKNWTETFKSSRTLKWRLKSIFTKKVMATILEQKDKPIFIDEQGIKLGDGTVVISPRTEGTFHLIIRP